jgi:hypothetical protein
VRQAGGGTSHQGGSGSLAGMSGNTFGRLFQISAFGESHGPDMGCVIDVCPAGLFLNRENIAWEQRRPRGGGGLSTGDSGQAAACPEEKRLLAAWDLRPWQGLSSP